MHLLYAIATQFHPQAEGLRGVLGLPVQGKVIGGGMYLYFSLLNEDEKQVSNAIGQAKAGKPLDDAQLAENPVWQHLHVWRELRQWGPCLPFRYPKLVEDLEEMERWAGAHFSILSDQFMHLGLGEAYRLQLIAAENHEVAAGQLTEKPTGTQYLMAKLQQQRQDAARQQQLEADFALLHPQLAAKATAAQPATKDSKGETAALYLLLPHQLADWKAAVQQLAPQFPAYNFRITGPWPPFEFMDKYGIL